MTMSLCAPLQLLVSGCILICLCVSLVRHILLSKANYFNCTVAAFMVTLYCFVWISSQRVMCCMFKALRKVWNVPPQTYNKTIALLSDSVPLDISLKAHFCKFAKKTICHKNKVIRFVMKMSVSNPWSVVGRNYQSLWGKENVLNDSWNEFITQDETCEIVSLKKLINVRDGYQLYHVFTKDEVNMFIELLCVK